MLPTADALYVLIFTSGSTGAPKAVRGTQGRFARFGAAMPFTSDDTLYCSMPLFHGNALASNFVPALTTGATIALRRTFSASEFFDDLRRFDATYFNTVGRALSYVLATPESSTGPGAPRASSRSVRSRRRPTSSAFRDGSASRVVQGYGSERRRHRALADARRAGGRARPARAGPGRRGRRIRTPVSSANRRGFDDDGRLVNAESAIGEIVRRDAAGCFEGYYNNPKRRPAPVPATAGTGRATSDTATTTDSSTSRAAPPTGSASTARISRPRRSNASSDRHPASRPSRCTPFPTRSPATR